jgi:predicted nucleic acid-binding protein
VRRRRATRGPVVIDTNILGAELTPRGAATVERYRTILAGRAAIASFMTEGELWYGAIRARWGEGRLLDLQRLLHTVHVAYPDPRMVALQIALRVRCAAGGHGLAEKVHEADRWVAATALYYQVPLISDDKIFSGVDGLDVVSEG